MGFFSLWRSKEPTTQVPTPTPAPAPAPAAPPAALKPEPSIVGAPLPPSQPTQLTDLSTTIPPSPSLSKESPPYPDVFSPRSLKQLGLFFGGASFLMLTVLASKRAAARHMKASALKFYQPTTSQGRYGQTEALKPGERDPMLAFEALKLATLSTISFGIMTIGGISWAFDVTNLDELRTKARRSMYGTEGRVDAEAEKEVAEWLTKVLEPKTKKDDSSVEEAKKS